MWFLKALTAEVKMMATGYADNDDEDNKDGIIITAIMMMMVSGDNDLHAHLSNAMHNLLHSFYIIPQ